MSSGFVVYEGLGFFCEGTFMFLLLSVFLMSEWFSVLLGVGKFYIVCFISK